MAREVSFDLDKLRRNWTEPEATTGVEWQARLGPVRVPVDLLTEVPVQLSALRDACSVEFGEHMNVLGGFLQEVEEAGRELVVTQSQVTAADPETAQRDEPVSPIEATQDAFDQDPKLRFEEALGSLEDLLEVFMTTR